jgi:hypothetical protein
MSLNQAAALVGLDPTTQRQWIERGEGRHPTRPPMARYVAFVAAIARAKALDEARRILRLEQAGQGGTVVHERTTQFADGRQVTERSFTPPDWRADAFILERRYPERWRPRAQADLRLQIEQIAQEIAEEVGIDPQRLIAEAQRYLKDHC